MDAVKTVTLLLALYSHKSKTKQLKSLQNHPKWNKKPPLLLNRPLRLVEEGAAIGFSKGGAPDQSPCWRKRCLRAWQQTLLHCTYLRRLEGERGRCVVKGGGLLAAGSENPGLSPTSWSVISKGQKGSVRVENTMPAFAGSPWQAGTMVVRGCWYKSTAYIPTTRNKSTQIKGVGGKV